jgi:hypothetical protein
MMVVCLILALVSFINKPTCLGVRNLKKIQLNGYRSDYDQKQIKKKLHLIRHPG